MKLRGMHQIIDVVKINNNQTTISSKLTWNDYYKKYKNEYLHNDNSINIIIK